MAAWVYIWAMIVTITAVAEYGSGFLASLFGIEITPLSTLLLTLALLLVALALNFSGTKTMARVAQIGLAAELVGVIGVGLYLLIFQRKQPFSVFFDTMGVQGDGSYATAFFGAALAGLFLFYGFERAEMWPRRSSVPRTGSPAHDADDRRRRRLGAVLVRRLRARRAGSARDRLRQGRRPHPAHPGDDPGPPSARRSSSSSPSPRSCRAC